MEASGVSARMPEEYDSQWDPLLISIEIQKGWYILRACSSSPAPMYPTILIPLSGSTRSFLKIGKPLSSAPELTSVNSFSPRLCTVLSSSIRMVGTSRDTWKAHKWADEKKICGSGRLTIGWAQKVSSRGDLVYPCGMWRIWNFARMWHHKDYILHEQVCTKYVRKGFSQCLHVKANE